MPQEDRRITFDYAELYKALYALCAQKELRKPPPGTIKTLAAKPDDPQIIDFEIENAQQSRSFQVEYSLDFIAAALMLFCKSLKIPLPKRSKKAVEIAGGKVTLHITI